MKSVYDHHPNIKIYASGSSSLAINQQIQESLAGRKRMLRIYPLNFQEYLHFRNRDDLNDKLKKTSTIQTENLDSLLPDVFDEFYRFLIFGGYPDLISIGSFEGRTILWSRNGLMMRGCDVRTAKRPKAQKRQR